MTDRGAGDPTFSADRLALLAVSRDRATRRLVASNPNTNIDDLDVLTRHFAADVAVNPVLDWCTLTNADWLADFSEVSRQRLLQEGRGCRRR